MGPIHSEANIEVPFSAEQLWPFVADTDRMDRAAGLPRVHVRSQVRREGGEVLYGEYRMLGRPMVRWLEHSFEWQWPRRFSVRRDYQSGPLRSFHGGTELLPTRRGTRLRSFVEITPRQPWLAPFVRFVLAPIGLRRAVRQHRAIASFLARRADNPFPALAAARTRADSARVRAGVAQLLAAGAPAEVANRLGLFLETAADEDIVAMRPLELSRRWASDARATLEVFVRATLVGLLELRWELLCPRCRGVKASATHLRDLTGGGACPTCNLHFLADQDEAIEARFYPNAAVRAVELGTYCVGGPMKTPHRVAQAVLAPGARVTWQLELAPGLYRLSSPQAPQLAHVVVEEKEPALTASVSLTADGLVPEQIDASRRVCLELDNATATLATVALDDVRWSELGATPGRLMTLPAFRTLLSPEALAPGLELAITRVAFLFTDLAGSTALYERVGDARAFRLVGAHFELLRPPIEESGGAIVKTIGDAVMAAFPDARSALTAALQMQRAIRSLESDSGTDSARLLKVGVHVGACYAVTLNDRLDYFGTAVNLAARAQHAALGGEVVVTSAVMAECRAQPVAAGVSAVPFEVQLKGFAEPAQLFRIRIDD